MRTKISAALAATTWMLGLAACGVSDSTPLPEAPSLGGSSTALTVSIPAGTWRLVSLRETGHDEVRVADPGAFAVEFAADGRVQLQADCNRCGGTYTAGSRNLKVRPMACTRAFCAATAPLDTTFTSLVGSAQTWTSPDDQHLELASASGVLRFQR
jgi:heat shock protein HslJ